MRGYKVAVNKYHCFGYTYIYICDMKTFLLPHCAGEHSQREALLLVQRLTQLALLHRQLNRASKKLNKKDSTYEEQKLLIEGSIELVSNQMAMQLLQFSGHWQDYDIKE